MALNILYFFATNIFECYIFAVLQHVCHHTYRHFKKQYLVYKIKFDLAENPFDCRKLSFEFGKYIGSENKIVRYDCLWDNKVEFYNYIGNSTAFNNKYNPYRIVSYLRPCITNVNLIQTRRSTTWFMFKTIHVKRQMWYKATN